MLGRIAMAMYINTEFEFSSQIRAVIDEARAINPNEMSVLQLLAADAEQREDYSDAIDYWRLMIQVNPNGEFAQELRFRIAAAQEILAGREYCRPENQRLTQPVTGSRSGSGPSSLCGCS